MDCLLIWFILSFTCRVLRSCSKPINFNFETVYNSKYRNSRCLQNFAKNLTFILLYNIFKYMYFCL